MSGLQQMAMSALKNKLSKDEGEGLTTQFRVVIPGSADVVFKSCEGMEAEIEVLSHPEGGRQGAPRTSRGVHKSSRISFGQGSSNQGSGGRSLFDWFQEVCDADTPLNKKSISIVVTDSQGHDVAEWRVVNAWPCRWMSPMMGTENNGLTVEYVSFAHEGIERRK